MRAETETAIMAITKAMEIIDSREGAEEVTSKGGIDLVTNADLQSEDAIRSVLTSAFPAIPVVGEERGGTPAAGKPYWLVDPICGTRPYASNVPLYCTNIALVEDGSVTVAAVGIGRTGEILHSEQDSGAWVRSAGADRSISVGDSSNTLWLGGRCEHTANITRDTLLADRWFIWMFSSSIAYPYLATGSISGLIHLSQYLSSVHTAAGCFIAQQAGALVTDIDGKPWNLETRSYLLAATAELHGELRGIIERNRP